jgi:hypothetical protein
MSIHPKHCVLYVAFVGLPMLGLVGVLNGGQGLKPPPSVEGKWQVDVQPGSAGDCPPVAGGKQATMDIAQSGSRVTLKVADASMKGKIRENRVNGEAKAMKVDAQLDPNGDTLNGTFEVASCGKQLPFKAKRDPSAPKPKGSQ